jgi:hypothetical protein
LPFRNITGKPAIITAGPLDFSRFAFISGINSLSNISITYLKAIVKELYNKLLWIVPAVRGRFERVSLTASLPQTGPDFNLLLKNNHAGVAKKNREQIRSIWLLLRAGTARMVGMVERKPCLGKRL